MAEEILFKPRDLYEKELKKKFHDASSEYFDELQKRSGVDAAANKAHVAAYEKKHDVSVALNKKLSSAKGIQNFLIAMSIVSFVAGLILFLVSFMGVSNKAIFIAVGVFLFVSGIASFVISLTVLKKRTNTAQERYDQAIKEELKAKQICYNDMVTLNSLYDWNMPAVIMKKATPIINIDQYFNNERLNYLVDKFKMPMPDDPDESVISVLSGSIQGNPFVEQKVLRGRMVPKVYTGTRVITWTTTYTDSKGQTHIQTHTETLVAHVTQPAPSYGAVTVLAYGNEAAPRLSFSRIPSKASGLSDKDWDKAVKQGKKELDKKAEAAIKNGGSFTVMGNDEFDVFFGADDRDNEVEFRLLFTPLAQKNEIELIKNSEPFGDDFSFKKKKMMNYICSGHSQSFNYLANPKYFVDFSLENARNKFVKYCDDFMKYLYFDLAPLLSIPLYQMHKPQEEIFKGLDLNFNQFEHEVLANKMPKSVFAPEGASESLPLIIKATKATRSGCVDNVVFHSYSYHEVPQVTVVRVHGGDGFWHDVPVNWTRYDLVEKDTMASFTEIGGTNHDFNALKNTDAWYKKMPSDIANGATYYERGILAVHTDTGSVEGSEKKFNLFS